MSIIKKIEEHVVYENPVPQLRSRHGYFPGIARLSSGELLVLFVIAEAFESVNAKVFVSRSKDSGKTWQLQGPLYDYSALNLDFPVYDSLKPTLLSNNKLIALGYRFHRADMDLPLSNFKTGGALPGDNIFSFSIDEGETWSIPEIINHEYPELLEISGPCIETKSGDLLAVACPYIAWDGSNPSGHIGILLRSRDKGLSWDLKTHFFKPPKSDISPLESRLCEMQDGRIVIIFWAYNHSTNKHLPNYIVVSSDNGKTWSDPINTNIMGQASNLMWLGGDKLLTVHAQRAENVGLFVCLIDFSNNKLKVIEKRYVWGTPSVLDTRVNITEQFASLQFGQPSLVNLDKGKVLILHWGVEKCLSKILAHRLKINL